jgi:uncharacterized protein YukE
VDASGIYATRTEGGEAAVQPQPPASGGGRSSGGGASGPGGLGSGFQVDPSGVQSVASRIAQAGVSAAQVLTELRSALESAGEPWGTDDLGKNFGKGYTEHVNQGFASIATLGDALTGIANALVGTANAHQATEGEVTKAFAAVHSQMDQGPSRGGGGAA